MEDSIYSMITAKETDLNDLYSRMDEDRKAVHMDKYTLTGFGKYKNKEIPRTVSVTMNEPGIFAHGIVSVLQGAKRQTAVEGLSDSQNKKIENFLDDCFYIADERLRKRRIASLWAFVCDHVAKRGPIGCRWTFDADGRPNCLPVDMRWCPFEDGKEDLAWSANHTRRSAEALRAEYGDLKEIPASGKSIDVYDFWNSKQNNIYVGGKKILELENPYGFVPFVIQFPSAGDYLMDEGYQKYWAESIFFLVRNLYPEWNRLMSIQQTMAIKIMKPPYVHMQKDPEGDPQEYPDEIATNLPYNEGEKPELLQTQDGTRAFQNAEVSMSTAIHKGSANITDLSDISGIRNASWITEQTEIRDKITIPRTQALEMFYQQSSVMVIKEYQIAKFPNPAPLGRAASRRIYTPADLGDTDSYTIEFKYMPDNTRQKLANYSVGLALKGELSRDTRIRDIYECDDPDGELDKLAVEEAEQANPIIFYYNKASRIIDVAKTKNGEEKKRLLRQARIMADSMVEAIKRQKTSSVDQGTQHLQLAKGNSQGLLALPSLAGGNNG